MTGLETACVRWKGDNGGRHGRPEDNVLFPMADRVLSPEDQRELGQRFEEIETEVMGPGVHERYHRLLDDLERELGLASG